MKNKNKKNINSKFKNFDLSSVKSLTNKKINQTKKKLGIILVTIKKRIKDKIDNEKRLKAEKKREILREQKLIKKEKLQKLREKLQILQQKN